MKSRHWLADLSRFQRPNPLQGDSSHQHAVAHLRKDAMLYAAWFLKEASLSASPAAFPWRAKQTREASRSRSNQHCFRRPHFQNPGGSHPARAQPPPDPGGRRGGGNGAGFGGGGDRSRRNCGGGDRDCGCDFGQRSEEEGGSRTLDRWRFGCCSETSGCRKAPKRSSYTPNALFFHLVLLET